MSVRDFDGEIMAHEAAIAALRREKRADRYRLAGTLPPVRSAQETGAMGGRAYMAKYGAMPSGGGRRPNPTYAEIMANTGGRLTVSARPRRPGRRPAKAGAPMG